MVNERVSKYKFPHHFLRLAVRDKLIYSCVNGQSKVKLQDLGGTRRKVSTSIVFRGSHYGGTWSKPAVVEEMVQRNGTDPMQERRKI